MNCQMREKNSSRVKPACSKIANRVPRGMSFPYGTMTRRVLPSGPLFTNARWLPFPRSGASAKPAFRSAWIIFFEERDGSRTRQKRFQAEWYSAFRKLMTAPPLLEGQAVSHWRYRVQQLLQELSVLFQESIRKKQPQAQGIWKHTVCSLSRSQPLDDSASLGYSPFTKGSIPDSAGAGNAGPGYDDTTDHIGIIAQELEPVAVKKQQAVRPSTLRQAQSSGRTEGEAKR